MKIDYLPMKFYTTKYNLFVMKITFLLKITTFCLYLPTKLFVGDYVFLDELNNFVSE